MERAALEQVVAQALIDERPSASVEVRGDDPVHPSPMQLGAGASAALAMVATAVDDIWAKRTGRRQRVEIDLRHAAVSISSAWLLRADGGRIVAGDAPPATQGIFRTADGRDVQLMDQHPGLARAALEVLQCEPTAEAVREAIARRTAAELEQAFVERGTTGVIIRSEEEWLAHPVGAALSEAAVVEVERIGDAPPTPLPSGPRPLSGLRVLEDTRVLAGPMISRTLAEFGADVLQIGAQRHLDEEWAAGKVDTAHGKRRAFLDLTEPEGLEQAQALLRETDVFAQSYRTGRVEHLGLGVEAVAAIRPGIIYVSMNAYGFRGPWVSKRGFDGVVQAASGIRVMNGPNVPGRVAMAMNDYCTGYWGAYGVLRALQLRAEQGGSYHVRVSLGQTASWFLRLGAPHNAEPGLSGEAVIEFASTFMERHDSPYGALDRLRPVIQMSETPAYWERPTVPPGTHAPEWE